VDSVAASDDDRYPIRGTFFGCCASAVTATGSTTTRNRIDKRPAFFIAHLLLAAFLSRIRKLRKVLFTAERRTQFIEGKKANFA
jgi:hypothetical protein